MLCSNCSEEVKPVVALDIDGTLARFHTRFIQFMQEYLDQYSPMKPYVGREPFKKWGMREFNIDERTWYDIKLAYRQGAQKRMMEAYPFAAELVRACKAAGAEVWLATTRPYNRLDNIDPDTRAWCERNGIEYDYMIADEHKYFELSKRVESRRVAAVLDDLVEQVNSAQLCFDPGVGILRRNEYNVARTSTVMVTDLNEAWLLIQSKLRMWKRMFIGVEAAAAMPQRYLEDYN